MKALGLTAEHAALMEQGLMPDIQTDEWLFVGESLAIVDRDAGQVVALVRVESCSWTPGTQFAQVSISVFYVFEQPIACAQGLHRFDWQIPQEWIDQAAKDAGMPGMAEIWKAVHNPR